jgi:hypothetical protein
VERVITYVDGFNLYFGMRSRGWRRYYWLDVKRLQQVASASLIIGRKKLADSQLPNLVPKADGYILRRPEKWR